MKYRRKKTPELSSAPRPGVSVQKVLLSILHHLDILPHTHRVELRLRARTGATRKKQNAGKRKNDKKSRFHIHPAKIANSPEKLNPNPPK